MSQYCASISYGKDSLAMLHVIVDILHKPLDRIITAEVWATDTIQADLPPMVEFKGKADQIIKERWGIEVEHLYATDKDGEKLTYEKMFYHIPNRRLPKMMGGVVSPIKSTELQSLDSHRSEGFGATVTLTRERYYGFPHQGFRWCGRLKDTKKAREDIKGFPLARGGWCKKLKYENVPKKALPQMEGR